MTAHELMVELAKADACLRVYEKRGTHQGLVALARIEYRRMEQVYTETKLREMTERTRAEWEAGR